ncbi:dethiobiotin synthase [Nocardioides sp.]|uniref:dethiobiotin synthase n=1 Tax=Nocardioides sp. TaxID=35761 RepID=UPI00271B1F73|nr:dethiobiotin synthase [Nocardioides sp.]MDO9454902.1 dethiobiotin synthase [Nocardioides sp.]
MTRVVVVTGTNTDVGKTIVTAAIAATVDGRVLVVKPAQTGVSGSDPGDADVVARLTGVDVETWTVLDEPLAPETAARRAGVVLPTVAEHAAHVRAVAASYDVVVVEGAGGLLVRLDSHGGTLLDLATELATTHDVEVVVVCAAALGTLNVAELTVGALRARGLEPSGVVIGSWPTEPGLAETCNREDLPRVTGLPLLGVVPAGAGSLPPAEFAAAATGWFA